MTTLLLVLLLAGLLCWLLVIWLAVFGWGDP